MSPTYGCKPSVGQMFQETHFLKRNAEKTKEFEVRILGVQSVLEHSVTALPFGALSYLALFGCFQWPGLLTMSVATQDGMSIVAAVTLPTLSVLVGIGSSKWKLQLHQIRDSR